MRKFKIIFCGVFNARRTEDYLPDYKPAAMKKKLLETAIIALPNCKLKFGQLPFDEDSVYLRFSGEQLEFEVSPQEVAVTIPLALWAAMINSEEAKVKLELADKTDDELRQIVEREVAERAERFQEACEKSKEASSFPQYDPQSAQLVSPIYGQLGGSAQSQVETSMSYYRQKRTQAQRIRREVDEIIAFNKATGERVKDGFS